MKKGILIIFFIGFFLSLFWLGKNNTMPVGYDHGAYREFINLMHGGADYYSLRPYLQGQFEPFSGVLFYYLRSAIPTNYILTWFYAAVYLGICLWLLFMGKRSNKYTHASYLGFGLAFFSVIQFKVMWWGFGKEMIATFFLLGAIRYNKKIAIATILLSACIALHRLTGFVGILYFLLLFLRQNSSRKKYTSIILVSIIIGALTYFWTWGKHISPFVGRKIQDYLFLKGPYGTLFSEGDFWFFQSFLLTFGLIGFITSYVYKRKSYIYKTHLLLFSIIAFMVITHCIAYTRMEAFFDLALILVLSQFLPQIFSKKVLVFIVGIQAIVWTYHFHLRHQPGITETELKKIEVLQKYLPKEAKIFSLNALYMPWLQGYSQKEILAPYIAGSIKNQGYSLVGAMQNKDILCHFLKKSPKNTYLFVGEKERFYPSIQNNPCLNEVIYINKKSRVFTLSDDYMQGFMPPR